MAEMPENEKTHHLPPSANPYGRLDDESATKDGSRRRHKSTIKCFTILLLLAILTIVTLIVLPFTILKFRSPSFRVKSAAFDTFTYSISTPSSFNFVMNTEINVENPNFGPFTYDNTTTVKFYYRGIKLGDGLFRPGRVKARSTGKFNVTVILALGNVPITSGEFAGDLSSGVLPLSSRSRTRGKISLWKVFKKNKSIDMSCTMNIIVGLTQLEDIICS